MVLTQTPLRCSLFGGGTDYPEWFMQREGAVLGMAINRYVYVGLHAMHPGQESRFRVQYSKVDDCQEVIQIKHPAVRAALQYYGINTPLELHCFGEMPGRGGLGSSSSFCIGLLKALQEHFGIPKTESPLDLASEAISFERHMIPESVGFQDQLFAAVGGLNYITFDKTGSTVQRLELSATRRAELEQSLMLVYTGGMRDAHKMAEKQIVAIHDNDTILESMGWLAEEGKSILLNERKPLQNIGRMLDSAWRLKRSICNGITSPEIDDLYTKGLSLGAIGGKLLGAGGGGFMLFFVPLECRSRFEQEIGSLHVKFKISYSGSRVLPLN